MKKGQTPRKKRIALYDPYLDVMGGGERHVLSILQVLDRFAWDIDIMGNSDLTHEINRVLNLSFRNLTFVKNIFTSTKPYEKLKTMAQYDALLYVTDGSYFVSSAKKTYIFCMIPDRKLYHMNLLNKIKTANATFITNSYFTYRWLLRWGVRSKILYPYIANEFFENSLTHPKKKIILSVGRFFRHLHSKRQDIAIKWFLRLKKELPSGYEYTLHLAGQVLPEDRDYLDELRALAGDTTSIVFHENISYDKLLMLYKQAEYYWHFAGYGIHEGSHPENTEHLGIAPLEAMASGCITFAYNAGGPKELIFQGKNGFLFERKDELFSALEEIQRDPDKKKKIQEQAHEFVRSNFSFEVFSRNVSELFL